MTATATRSTYHHGDLRAALVTAANAMLEEGQPLSLRALARRAGVSPTALYRHFADKEALESALAVQGMRDLFADLTAGRPGRNGTAGPAMPSTRKEVIELGVRYVRFALRRPELFKLMFGRECDVENDERVRAAAALHDHLAAVMAQVFPDANADDLATAGWGLAHGLAFLHLDGKLPKDKPRAVDRRVRAAYAAILPTTN
ncbi:TetR family transcriptional regulator [Knoellia remsis]|uniref:TetR family transcriptional regulator n=1 Tax=Knoellia remsis TaxID=407159 RepID=A0A2T0UGR9_9MICO|nr:TetR/AcrR family transcriptional regulator [Knoellia remsis]PRY57074.1 TetR family transcriptional regulator [Knoellia remsis]